MASKKEMLAHAKAKISQLDTNIRKLNEQMVRQMAEKKSYEDMINWLTRIYIKENNEKVRTNKKTKQR